MRPGLGIQRSEASRRRWALEEGQGDLGVNQEVPEEAQEGLAAYPVGPSACLEALEAYPAVLEAYPAVLVACPVALEAYPVVLVAYPVVLVACPVGLAACLVALEAYPADQEGGSLPLGEGARGHPAFLLSSDVYLPLAPDALPVLQLSCKWFYFERSRGSADMTPCVPSCLMISGGIPSMPYTSISILLRPSIALGILKHRKHLGIGQE